MCETVVTSQRVTRSSLSPTRLLGSCVFVSPPAHPCAGVIALHDRRRFHVTFFAAATRVSPGDPLTLALTAASDALVHIGDMAAADAAQEIQAPMPFEASQYARMHGSTVGSCAAAECELQHEP